MFVCACGNVTKVIFSSQIWSSFDIRLPAEIHFIVRTNDPFHTSMHPKCCFYFLRQLPTLLNPLGHIKLSFIHISYDSNRKKQNIVYFKFIFHIRKSKLTKNRVHPFRWYKTCSNIAWMPICVEADVWDDERSVYTKKSEMKSNLFIKFKLITKF